MNLRHETFITQMIAHGNRQQAYLVAYPQSSPAAAYNNACRLLAKPHIAARIAAAMQAAQQQATEHLQEQYHIQLTTTLHKRALLGSIIRTALFQNTQFPTTGNNPEPFRKQPTVSQILKAIQLDTHLEQNTQKHPQNYQ
ncbi:MAG TPA: terminase small subunit [Flavipsychrobacter sp.]